MMDINKYLTRYTILHEPKYDRFGKIIKGFPQEIDGKYRSNFVEIYSTFIFPRRIKLNGKQYIIIDHHFENLFAHYSSAVCVCLEGSGIRRDVTIRRAS